MSTDITQTEMATEARVAKGGCCGPSISSRAIDDSPRISGISSPQDWVGFLRHWLRDRRVLVVLGLAVLVGAAALNWGWLVAIGVAPVLLAMAPCGIMCALGLCKMGKGTSTGGTNAASDADGSPSAGHSTNRQ